MIKFGHYQLSDKEQLVRILTMNTPTYFDVHEIKDFEKYLEEQGDTYLTIYQGNDILGGVGCNVEEKDNSGRINWIFIHPKWHNIGIGAHAAEYCLQQFKSNDSLEKLVVRTSQLAFGFFEKYNYKVVKIEENYWAEGHDLYHMERKVNL